MAITTFDAYVDAAFNRSQGFYGFPPTNLGIVTSGTQYSWWTISGYSGGGDVPPTGSGDTCSSSSNGAPRLVAATGGRTLYLGAVNVATSLSAGFFLNDRLVHTSGLDATLTTAQTVNTVALPARATGGVGVVAALEIYSTIGTTSTTATLNYTNSAGVSGKTATVTLTGTAPNLGRFMPFAWSAGDLGVQSVQSVTLAGSTGAAGNFGVTLFKPLITIPPCGATVAVSAQSVFDQGTPPLDSNSCLFITTLTSGAVSIALWGIQTVEGL